MTTPQIQYLLGHPMYILACDPLPSISTCTSSIICLVFCNSIFPFKILLSAYLLTISVCSICPSLAWVSSLIFLLYRFDLPDYYMLVELSLPCSSLGYLFFVFRYFYFSILIYHGLLYVVSLSNSDFYSLWTSDFLLCM